MPASAEAGEYVMASFFEHENKLAVEWRFGLKTIRAIVKSDNEDWWRHPGALGATIDAIWRRYRALRAELAPKPHIKLRAA